MLAAQCTPLDGPLLFGQFQFRCIQVPGPNRRGSARGGLSPSSRSLVCAHVGHGEDMEAKHRRLPEKLCHGRRIHIKMNIYIYMCIYIIMGTGKVRRCCQASFSKSLPSPSPFSPRPDVEKRQAHAAFSHSHRRPVREPPGLHPICERLVRRQPSLFYTFTCDPAIPRTTLQRPLTRVAPEPNRGVTTFRASPDPSAWSSWAQIFSMAARITTLDTPPRGALPASV